MKICCRCKIEKLKTEFNKCKNRKDGLQTICRVCNSDYHKEHNSNNPNARIEHYRKNREIILEKKKEYYADNIEKISTYRKSYYADNKEKITKRNYNYKKTKLKEDSLFYFENSIRNVIYGSLYRHNYTKKSKTYKILGCSYEEFKHYIEKQFVEGMSWDNQGEWHLDHIYPVSLATNEEEIIKLNHYTNFQPLWAIDNLKKSNKIIGLSGQ
jgi:hypothetical protein